MIPAFISLKNFSNNFLILNIIETWQKDTFQAVLSHVGSIFTIELKIIVWVESVIDNSLFFIFFSLELEEVIVIIVMVMNFATFYLLRSDSLTK